MAASQAAFKVEEAVGHDGSAITKQDVSNPGLDRSKYADPSGEKMKALVWLGKGHVEVRKLLSFKFWYQYICRLFYHFEICVDYTTTSLECPDIQTIT